MDNKTWNLIHPILATIPYTYMFLGFFVALYMLKNGTWEYWAISITLSIQGLAWFYKKLDE